MYTMQLFSTILFFGLAVFLICVPTTVTAAGKYNLRPALELQVPDEVIVQNDFSGFCVAHSNLPPRVLAHNCHIIEQSSTILRGSRRIDFFVRNVTTPCKILCHLIQSRLQKLVNVLEAKILSTQTNITVWKGLPFKLGCTSWGRPESYHVIWMTEEMFIKNDEHHDISSSTPFKDSQKHELVVHSASNSATYKCLLINTNGRIVGSFEQHVSVEDNDDKVDLNSVVRYLMPYFRWAE